MFSLCQQLLHWIHGIWIDIWGPVRFGSLAKEVTLVLKSYLMLKQTKLKSLNKTKYLLFLGTIGIN